MENNNKFWFFLESHIYVNIKSNAILLYDTFTGKSLYSEFAVAIQLVNKIYEDKNLGCVELERIDLNNPEMRCFVEEVISNGMGKLLDQNEHITKPVILLPILSLCLDIDRLKETKNLNILLGRDISKYLLDVNIVLNTSCQQRCPHCQNYCKQFFCCSKEDKSMCFTRDSLVNLFGQIKFFPLRTINITGGDIYQYKDLDVFNNPTGDNKKVFNFYIHYLNYQKNSIIDSQKIHIIINTPVNINKLNEAYFYTKNKDTKFHLVVENDEQFEELESVMSELGVEEYEVHPYYNGENLQFFEENVYLSKEDIIANTISMREIFRNQKMNANSFGSLYILPNGDIKANMNEKVLGNIEKDKIIDIINEEMMQNTAWRKVRSLEPCNNCLYQYLCPPLSNYERVINKQNLCHVSQ
ncbi:MAG: TIGR04150 pseudo-rSAM protein [Bacteroidaceae bacterium]|nr:TIGR04150 pseudo-rSAM protein [Bacteroidaceae bacterium]MBO4841254.1 TIGR04150 pseudo-rSAM protein [Bacteroidaceae bacterium]